VLIWENNVFFYNLNNPPSLQYTCNFLNRRINGGSTGNWEPRAHLQEDSPLHTNVSSKAPQCDKLVKTKTHTVLWESKGDACDVDVVKLLICERQAL